jgi:hypothetical protein
VSIGSGYTASTNGSSAAEQDATSMPADGPSGAGSDILRNRPEVLVGAAFAGGILAALLLRRLGR